MLETYWTCPLCASEAPQHDHLDYVNDRIVTAQGAMPIPIYYVFCKVCGMVWQRMGLSDEAQAMYYQASYRTGVQGTDEVTDRALEEQDKRAKVLVDDVMPDGPFEKMLDVGASAGSLLKLAKEDGLAKKGYGVEPGKAFRKHTVREQGFTCYPSISKINKEQANTFDLITIIHTLEHVSFPRDVLTLLARNWAKPGATLVVEVPDLYYEWSVKRLAHPVIFTPSTLDMTLRVAGWTPQEVRNYPGIKTDKENILAIATFEEEPPSVEFTNELDLDLYDEQSTKFEQAQQQSLEKMRLG